MGVANWIGLWAAIMPLAVILYYFFRKKYKDQPVSSTLFWQEMMKEIQASPYLKKLQHHLLFYLQMAALLLCVFGLLQPFFETDTLEGNEFIFVVDTSATMLAGTPSHFEKQQTNMRELANQTGGKPVTIVTTGASPEVVLRKERDLATIQEAIRNLTPAYENAEIEQTLLFAETLVANDSTVIHIFTDNLDRSLLASKSTGAYVVHGMEDSLSNVSIRQFGLSEDENGMKAIVQVVNDSDEAMSGKATVSSGTVTESVEITLEPGEQLLVPFDGLPAEKLWQAELEIEDDYAVDNGMAAYVQPPIDAIVIASSLHQLVASGFASLDMEVTAVAPEQISQQQGVPIVTNQVELLEKDQPVLLIGRNDETAKEVSGEIETLPHPLFTYATLDDVYVSQVYPPFDGFETIAEIAGNPLIQVSPDGDIVVLADIQSTDWPLHPSFPLFLWSAANELSGSEEFLGFFQPNEHRSVALASADGEWELFKDGEYIHSYIEGQGPFIAPAEPGVYDLVGGAASMKAIVQLSSEEKVLAAGSSYQIGQAAAEDETMQLSIVPWILLIVIILLVVEWEVYRRGIAIR